MAVRGVTLLLAAALFAPRAEAQYDFRAQPLALPLPLLPRPVPIIGGAVANGAPDHSLHLVR